MGPLTRCASRARLQIGRGERLLQRALPCDRRACGRRRRTELSALLGPPSARRRVHRTGPRQANSGSDARSDWARTFSRRPDTHCRGEKSCHRPRTARAADDLPRTPDCDRCLPAATLVPRAPSFEVRSNARIRATVPLVVVPRIFVPRIVVPRRRVFCSAKIFTDKLA